MPHKIEISDKTFEKLKEYCQLNGLKIGQEADKLVYDGLMMEMYGDVPFTTYKKPVKGENELEMVSEAVDEHLDDIVGFKHDGAGGPDVLLTRRELPEFREFKEKVKEMEESVKEDREAAHEKIVEMTQPQKETLKESGIPTKVINRMTKRRLK